MAESRFLFLDGNPAWLDFVNTQLVEHGAPADRLQRFSDLVDWLWEAGLLDLAQADRAMLEWDDGEEGRTTLRRAKEFRALLRFAAERLWNAESFPPSAVRAVNDWLASATGSHRLVARKGRFELKYESTPTTPRHLLEPLARSIGGFLERKDLGRVRKCGNPKCVLFFYDDTKNRARRWCSMAVCGNRMKAAAHYQRRKDSAP
jgi:predicted RNA-binding Zn ribbon-like protein